MPNWPLGIFFAICFVVFLFEWWLNHNVEPCFFVGETVILNVAVNKRGSRFATVLRHNKNDHTVAVEVEGKTYVIFESEVRDIRFFRWIVLALGFCSAAVLMLLHVDFSIS